LDVARQVFLEHGISATTSEVAARARVSEGTLFHRFKSKDALFRAAMRFDPEALPGFVESLTEGGSVGDLRERLRDFAGKMLELGRTAVPVMMMSWSNPSGEYRLETLVERGDGYRRTLRAVAAFFARELGAHELPTTRAELFARIFMGSLHHYCMSELIGATNDSSNARREFTRGVVEVLLAAAGYSEEAAPRRARSAQRAKRG
jgi:AcrR family transcriptional regulator